MSLSRVAPSKVLLFSGLVIGFILGPLSFIYSIRQPTTRKIKQKMPFKWSNLLSFFYSESPLPKDLMHWGIEHQFDVELLRAEITSCRKAWKYLEPFFASRGYIFYIPFRPSGSPFIAAPSDPEIRSRNIPEYPYARRIYDVNVDTEALFDSSSMQVWPARDLLGRDVIIKVVADDTDRVELDIYKTLNTKEMRSDPRNHTIPIIEFPRFEKYTFVVMPRWRGGLCFDFGTVAELLWFMRSILEVFDFLHEHRIVHFDFLEQNLGINVLANVNVDYVTGLLDPSATKYALFDFGASKQYSSDCVIEDVKETRFFNFRLRDMPTPEGAYNPFQVEMYSVGLVLQRNVRHIENIIPELGRFFDAMLDAVPTKRLTGRQALDEFKRIYSGLSDSQLHSKITTLFWENGKIIPKRLASDV